MQYRPDNTDEITNNFDEHQVIRDEQYRLKLVYFPHAFSQKK